MSMRFQFDLVPFGWGDNRVGIGDFYVYSSGDRHVYNVTLKNSKTGDRIFSGSIPKRQPNGKRRSGHRNFLHLIADIIDDIGLDNLGEDYVDVFAEVKEMYPAALGNISDYPDE